MCRGCWPLPSKDMNDDESAIGKMAVQVSPAMKQRRLASPTWVLSH
jgi:hypothetical protein